MELAPTGGWVDDEVCVSFESWTRQRKIVSIGTNAGAEPLPFQSWHHFKEAFAPEVVARAVRQSQRNVTRCLDPFGGSGTTALACQFLGVAPTTIEVNPYTDALTLRIVVRWMPSAESLNQHGLAVVGVTHEQHVRHAM